MTSRWGILSKYRNELYGFSIIWIMLFHGMNIAKCDLPKAFYFIKPFLKHGSCGVEIFLFLSGVCLFFSMKKNDSIKSFYKKRIIRIIFPLFMIDGLYWLYTCILKQGNLLLFLEKISFYSFWLKKDNSIWFIAFIILMYFLYPVIYMYIDNIKNRFMVYFAIIALSYTFCVLLNYNYHSWFSSVEIALNRIPVFLLGCYAGKLVYEDIEINSYIKLSTLLILFYGITFFYQHPYSLVKYYRVTYFFVGPSIALWIAIILDFIADKKLNRLLQFWGGLSLELYLSHLVLREIWLTSYFYTNNTKHNYFIYVLICIIGATFISFVINVIDKKYFQTVVRKCM